MRRLITVIFLLVAGLGILPAVALAAAYDMGPDGGALLPRLTAPSYAQMVYASSIAEAGTETVISIKNQRPVDCVVTVEWLYGYGTGDLHAGQSGPVTLLPGYTWEFTTANPGEIVQPFTLNVFRDTTQSFEGKARVIATCQGDFAPRLAIQATLVVNIDPTTKIGGSYMDLNVLVPAYLPNKGD